MAGGGGHGPGAPGVDVGRPVGLVGGRRRHADRRQVNDGVRAVLVDGVSYRNRVGHIEARPAPGEAGCDHLDAFRHHFPHGASEVPGCPGQEHSHRADFRKAPTSVGRMRVLIDGVPADPSTAAVSVFDWGLQRGDGLFEVARSYDGRVFALDAHLDRLAAGAEKLELDLPPRADIAEWINAVGADGGRLLRTSGGDERRDRTGIDVPARCIVMWEPMPEPNNAFRILPVDAPWHSGGVDWDLTGAKVISYAPNMSAGRRAKRAGFDDALLIARDGWVS